MARRMLDSIKEVDERNLKKGEEYKVAKKRAELNVNEMIALLSKTPTSINPNDVLMVAKANNIINDFNNLNTLSPQTTAISYLINNYNEIATRAYEQIDILKIKEKSTLLVREALSNAKAGRTNNIDEYKPINSNDGYLKSEASDIKSLLDSFENDNLENQELQQSKYSDDELEAEIAMHRNMIDELFEDSSKKRR